MSANARDDADLMRAIADGDMAALGELVRRHEKKAFALACRLLAQPDAAEDVTQEAFLHVYRAARRYRPKARFTTWLYRIVVNLCLDARRRPKRAPGELPAYGLAAEAPTDCDQLELLVAGIDIVANRGVSSPAIALGLVELHVPLPTGKRHCHPTDGDAGGLVAGSLIQDGQERPAVPADAGCG